MDETKFKKRHATGIAIAVVLTMVNILFIFISVPILLIVIIDYILSKPKRINIDDEKVPIEDEINTDYIRASIEKIEKINDEEKEYRRNIDIKQFKGRNDVTKEEVEKFLWVHYEWEGFKEKKIILEEIEKETNLTKDDIKWILHEHYNKEINGEKGGGCWERNDEYKKELEYTKDKINQIEKEYDKIEKINQNLINEIPILKGITEVNHKIDDDIKYRYFYEKWLKEKGYT